MESRLSYPPDSQTKFQRSPIRKDDLWRDELRESEDVPRLSRERGRPRPLRSSGVQPVFDPIRARASPWRGSGSCRFRPLHCGLVRRMVRAGPYAPRGLDTVARRGTRPSAVSAGPATKAAADVARTPGRSAGFVIRCVEGHAWRHPTGACTGARALSPASRPLSPCSEAPAIRTTLYKVWSIQGGLRGERIGLAELAPPRPDRAKARPSKTTITLWKV